MKYFLSTHFIERPNTIDLISVGLFAEDGREYYAVHTECDCKNADDWVKGNVLSKLPQWSGKGYNNLRSSGGENYGKKTIEDIKKDILFFTGQNNNAPEKPEFYAYFSHYHWVAFCWIFGKMPQLPKNYPMFCFDLKQMMEERGLTLEWKDTNYPDNLQYHDALANAKWKHGLYQKIITHDLVTQTK